MQVNSTSAGRPPTRTATAATPAASEVSPLVQRVLDDTQLSRAVKAANRALDASASGIEFSVDRGSSKTMMVRITDKQTHQIIR